jgi:uncharacterized protein YkwD
VSRLRTLLGASALVIACLPAAAGSATASADVFANPAAPAAQVTSVHRATVAHRASVRRHRRRTHHAVSCAKRASFHSSGGHVPRRHRQHRGASCGKRGSGKHGAGGQGAGNLGSDHSTGSGRTGHHGGHHGSSSGKPADAGACPGADLRPSQGNLEAVRSATLCLVNQERTNRGEPALQPNTRLQHAAQGHSDDMVSKDYFEHSGPQGDTPLSRMTDCGYIYSSQIGYEIGENIGWGTLTLSTPRAIVAAWMASPGHRANILDAHFRDTAIGVSPEVPSSLGQGQAGGIYTQDFGVIITG